MNAQWLSYGIMAIIGASALILLIKTIKFGGLKAAIFGAPVQATVGEVRGAPLPLTSLTVQVNKLGGSNPGRTVGLAIVAKSCGGFRWTPITLSASEAKRLATLLESAAALPGVG
jgi:hypothetical protein